MVVDEDIHFDQVFISQYYNDKFNDSYEKVLKNIKDLKKIKVCSILLNYMLETQKRELDHIQVIQEVKTKDFIYMDSHTKKSLKLVENADNESYGTLQWLLDDTKLVVDGRLLRQ